MPRGRQYYDPIEQHPAIVQGTKDLARIELYPEGDAEDPNPKWRGRRITAEGTIAEVLPGDFDHDRALMQAQQHWANLPVYELRSEGEDSTWEGHGPSPRLWQVAGVTPTEVPPAVDPQTTAEIEVSGSIHGWEGSDADYMAEQVSLRLLPISEPGAYVLLADICALLELWAVAYEVDKNPSGALALREAVDALKDVG